MAAAKTDADLGFTNKTFAFLADLEANNEREWFNANRATFDTYLAEPFAFVLDCVTLELSDAAMPLRGSDKTMFRMNRDVRFSKDKRPYKTACSGLLTPTGKKSDGGPLVYLHLDKSGGFVASGFYRLTPKQLAPIRHALVTHDDDVDEFLADLDKAGLHLDDEDMLTSMPRGFSEHDEHRHAEIIKRKSFIVKSDLPKSAWLNDEVVGRVAAFARQTMPLLKFLEKHAAT